MTTKEKIAKRAEEIVNDLKGFISEKGLERATAAGIEGNSLPKSGTFATYKKSGEKEFAHVRMTVKDSDDTISMSNIRIVAPKATEEATFGKIAKEGNLKGKLYLKGKSINPQFAKYSTVELMAFLEGKSFTAKPIDVQQLTFSANGYSTEEEAREALNVKTAYVITIED